MLVRLEPLTDPQTVVIYNKVPTEHDINELTTTLTPTTDFTYPTNKQGLGRRYNRAKGKLTLVELFLIVRFVPTVLPL